MIRPTTPDDTAAILALAVSAGLFPADATDEVAGVLTAALGGDLGPDHLWVTDDDDGPVGVAYFAPERMTEGTWNLYMLAVHPDRQRRGRGAALVRHVEAALAARGARILLVETSGRATFERTRAFYRALGYDQEARIRDFYTAGDDKIIFRKALAAPQERTGAVAVGFESHDPGPYTTDMARADWGAERLYDFNEERTEVVAGGAPAGTPGQALRVFYPHGAISPRASGTEFKVRLDAADELYCDYFVQFEPGFEFNKGGKLPGLAGGRANTGKRPSTGDGWSARYMWKGEGRLILYLYHLGQAADAGDNLALAAPHAEPGQWIRLTQFVRVNTANTRDGVARVWVNGALALDRRDLLFRCDTQAPVDRFLFSTFFGGSTPDWAPSVDCYARFDDFAIGPTRPEGLEAERA